MRVFKLIVYLFVIMILVIIIGAATYGMLFSSYEHKMAADWLAVFEGIGMVLFSHVLKKNYPQTNNKLLIPTVIITILAIFRFIYIHLIPLI